MNRPAAALAALTLVRLLVAASTPLSPDETYYWTWSKALAGGYLDHPPMVALWIRIGTTIAGDDPLGVRLLAPLSALVGSLLAAAAARDLLGLDRQRQVAAAALLNATLMIGAGAVTMTPDTPLLCFWTAALWLLGRSVATGSDAWLIGASVCIGLAFDSKYTGALLLPAVGLWLLSARGPRAVLTSWRIWTGAGACLLAVLPVIAWNAAHGFASFAKQGGRAGDFHLASAVRFLPELLGGQIGLATPLVAILFCAGIARTVGLGRRGDRGAALLAWTTLLPAALFVMHALGDRVQANWPSVLYPSAAIAAASTRIGWKGWRAASLLGFVVTALVYVQATLHPWVLPGRSDVTLARLAGWRDLSRQIRSEDAGLGCPVAADDYGVAAELAWQGAAGAVLGTGRRWSYVDLPRTRVEGCVLLVRSTRRRELPDPRVWVSAVRVATLVRARGARIAERYDVYRATGPVTASRLPLRPAPGHPADPG